MYFRGYKPKPSFCLLKICLFSVKFPSVDTTIGRLYLRSYGQLLQAREKWSVWYVLHIDVHKFVARVALIPIAFFRC